MCLLLRCRVLQHITIRKEEEEVHTAIEAGLPDEDIGKLARISHRVRKGPLIAGGAFNGQTPADRCRPLQTLGHSSEADSIQDQGTCVLSLCLPCKTEPEHCRPSRPL